MKCINLTGTRDKRFGTGQIDIEFISATSKQFFEFIFQRKPILLDIKVIALPRPEGVALAVTMGGGNMMTQLMLLLTSMAPANLSIVLVHHRGGYTHGVAGISRDPWEGIEGLNIL